MSCCLPEDRKNGLKLFMQDKRHTSAWIKNNFQRLDTKPGAWQKESPLILDLDRTVVLMELLILHLHSPRSFRTCFFVYQQSIAFKPLGFYYGYQDGSRIQGEQVNAQTKLTSSCANKTRNSVIFLIKVWIKCMNK